MLSTKRKVSPKYSNTAKTQGGVPSTPSPLLYPGGGVTLLVRTRAKLTRIERKITPQ